MRRNEHHNGRQCAQYNGCNPKPHTRVGEYAHRIEDNLDESEDDTDDKYGRPFATFTVFNSFFHATSMPTRKRIIRPV